MVDFDVSDEAEEEWTFDEKAEVIKAAGRIDFALMREGGAGFIGVYGGTVTFQKTGQSCAEAFGNDTYTCYGSSHGNTINIYTNAEGHIVDNPRFLIHELGHSFERAVGDSIPSNAIIESSDDINNRGGFAGDFPGWQQSTDDSAGEIFADMFIGWVYNQWEVDPFTGALTNDAELKANFMTTNMSIWIDTAHQGN